MNLSKANFFLTILLLIGISAIFVQMMRLTKDFDFAERRIDELEKKPLSTQETVYPQTTNATSPNLTSLTDYIDQTLATLSGKPKVTATPLPTQSSKQTQKTVVSFVPIFGGSFQTTASDWTDVPGSDFEFNVSEYGSGSYITWNAATWVIGGSGEVGLRVLDTTHGVVVPGSEVYLSASKSTLLVSGRMTFLSGNNKYKVQIKSQTTSPVVFDFGRIKIVY